MKAKNDGRSITFDGCEDDAGQVRFHIFADGSLNIEIFDQDYKREKISCCDRNTLLLFLAEVAVGRIQTILGPLPE